MRKKFTLPLFVLTDTEKEAIKKLPGNEKVRLYSMQD